MAVADAETESFKYILLPCSQYDATLMQRDTT